MASKNPRPIHHQMLKASWVEDKALAKILPARDYRDLPRDSVVFDDPEFPIGPNAINLAELRARYGEEA